MGGGIICTTQTLLLALALGGLLLPNEAAGQQNNDMLSNIFGVTLNDFQDNDVYYFPCAGTPCVPICWDACAVGANAYLEMPNGTLYTLFLQGLHLAEFVVCPPTIDVACAEPLQADGCWHFWSGAVPSQWTNGNYPYPVPIDGTCYFEQSGQYLMQVFMWADANSDGIPEPSNSNPMGWYIESDSPTCINILNETYEPSVQIEPATNICLGETVTIVISSPLDGIDQVQWTWTQPDGTEGDILGFADCGVFPNPPVTACQAIEITPTMTGTQTITLNMTNFASGDNCPENLFAETLQIEVSNDACCIDPNGPCCLEPDGTACCIAQTPASDYIWFDTNGTIVPAGTADASPNITINSSQTWNSGGTHPFTTAAAGTEIDPIFINGTITLTSGTAVTANNMHFRFGPNGRIVVRPGANLVLSDGVYTANEECEAMWQGIRQFSTKNALGQFISSSYVEIKNGAVIEHALVGIATMPTSLYDLDNMAAELVTLPDFGLNNVATTLLSDLFNATTGNQQGGGDLYIKSATFQNCFIGIANMFNPATTTNISGNFTVTSDNLRYPFQNLSQSETGVLLYRSRVSIITESNFEQQKYGVRSHITRDLRVLGSTFEHCRIGLSARNMVNNPTFDLRSTNNHFNHCGIGLQGQSVHAKIRNCTVNEGITPTSPYLSNNTIGFLLMGSLVDISHQNIIEKVTVGILGVDAFSQGIIHGNTIRETLAAIAQLGDNQNLNITCNDLIDYQGFGLALLPWTGAGQQGTLSQQGLCDSDEPAFSQPAANLFSTAVALPADVFSLGDNYEYRDFQVQIPPFVDFINVNFQPCNSYDGYDRDIYCAGTSPMAPTISVEDALLLPEGPERDQILKRWLITYADAGDKIAMLQLLDAMNSNIAKRMKVSYIAEESDSTQIAQLLAQLPQLREDDEYFDYFYKLLLTLQSEGRGYADISPDEEAVLLDIAYSKTATAYRAQTLLFAARGYEFGLDLPDLHQIVQGANFQTAFKTNNTASIGFVPNPASNKATLHYNLSDAEGNPAEGILQLRNLNGREIYRHTLRGNGMHELALDYFSPGIYIYTLSNGAAVWQYGKLVVAK
jgi:hypothetical protein